MPTVVGVGFQASSITQKGRPAKVVANAGLMPVQLRFQTGLTGADYVTREGWRLATLERCPLHAQGGCGFSGHGTYARRSPPGTRIARWRCPTGRCTFSLLPDHLAARFPGTLAEIEHVVSTVEQARSLEAAANDLRREDITLPSAVRWVRRRLDPVRDLLTIMVGLFPQLLLGCAPRISEFRVRLECAQVLESLRALTADQLPALRAPLGLRPPPYARGRRKNPRQQPMGPAPPPQAP